MVYYYYNSERMFRMRKVSIFDSTLRDGAQGTGISFSAEDKLHAVRLLDEIGVDYIEGGNPGSNPKDAEFYKKVKNIKLKNARIAAFGSTRRKDSSVNEDASLKALVESEAEICVIFGKCSLFHVKNVLETSPEENLAMITESCRFLKEHDREVFFDAEHFFDGFRDNREYAIKCIKSAEESGADLICLCDTNGGTFPTEAAEVVKAVKREIKVPVAVHFHNDCGMAVANSVICTRAGADQVQGTFLGIGERCGNANLSTIIPDLQLKLGYDCIPQEKLKDLTKNAREMAELNNSELPGTTPFVGDGAFAHKAGMHAAGVLKNTRSFEHIDPLLVGNVRKFPTSEISGRAVIFERIHALFPKLKSDSSETAAILEEIKHLENSGYQFEAADASFELLLRKQLGLFHSFFRLISYRIYTGFGTGDDCSASCTVKVKVGDEIKLMAAEGNGPVNALDKALRKALEEFFPDLCTVKLVDYKVRVLDSNDATAASVRVLISSTDGKETFTTVGVSEDVVDASWIALNDSLEYILMKHNVNK